MKFEAVAIELPASKADEVDFKNFNARAYAPVVIFIDVESLINPIESCDDNPSSSWTRNLEKHTSCRFCLVIIERSSLQPVHVSIDRSPTCLRKMAIQFQANAKENYQIVPYRVHKIRLDDSSDQVTAYRICEKSFLDEMEALDHCHTPGIF